MVTYVQPNIRFPVIDQLKTIRPEPLRLCPFGVEGDEDLNAYYALCGGDEMFGGPFQTDKENLIWALGYYHARGHAGKVAWGRERLKGLQS